MQAGGLPSGRSVTETRGALEVPARSQSPLVSKLVATSSSSAQGPSQDSGPGRVKVNSCPSFPGCEFSRNIRIGITWLKGLIFNWKQV